LAFHALSTEQMEWLYDFPFGKVARLFDEQDKPLNWTCPADSGQLWRVGPPGPNCTSVFFVMVADNIVSSRQQASFARRL
jgi:hypothetical protein